MVLSRALSVACVVTGFATWQDNDDVVRAQRDARYGEMLHAEAVSVYEGRRRIRELAHAKKDSEC